MQEIRNNTTCFMPVVRNGWIIKFSVHSNSNVLLVFTSKYTGQTIVRYFTDEEEAVDCINMIIQCNPREIQTTHQ